MWKRLQLYTQSDIMKFIIDIDQFIILHKALLLPPPQGFGLVTPDPFFSCELGGVWARDVNPLLHHFGTLPLGLGLGTRLDMYLLKLKERPKNALLVMYS